MIISPDDFRVTADGKYDSSKETSTLAWEESFKLLNDALAKGPSALILLVGIPGSGKSTWAKTIDNPETILFDATFSRRAEREPLIQFAQAAKVRVEAVVFLTPISVCIQRNWQRPEDRRVPYAVMAAMHENLRKEPVNVAEGIAKIISVREGGS
jgi:predicted kinase